jgi:ribosomal protein S18 acetylase RimI-like enzyme
MCCSFANMSNVTVRRVMPDDWPQLRSVRLAALADSPDAFSVTYETAASFPDSVWIDRAALAAEGPGQVTFVPVDGRGALLGMVAGLTDPDDPSVCRLVSLWIHPRVRRGRYGSTLSKALCEWASTSGFENVELWVTATNDSAIQMYEVVGFSPTGRTRPHLSNPDLKEAVYNRNL